MTLLRRLIFLPFLLLTACAPPKSHLLPDETQQTIENPKQPITQENNPSLTPQKITAATKVPSSWELSGAMAARSKKKAWSASVNWLQRGAGAYQIRLFGPLGSGTVIIEKQGGTITYRDGPKSASSSNADELLKQQTGVRLPVNNLYYWVRGIAAPGAVQSAQHDQANRLLVLRQAGFTIEYLGYKTIGGTTLPSLIKMQGNGVFIKFVIKRWKV